MAVCVSEGLLDALQLTVTGGMQCMQLTLCAVLTAYACSAQRAVEYFNIFKQVAACPTSLTIRKRPDSIITKIIIHEIYDAKRSCCVGSVTFKQQQKHAHRLAEPILYKWQVAPCSAVLYELQLAACIRYILSAKNPLSPEPTLRTYICNRQLPARVLPDQCGCYAGFAAGEELKPFC